MEDHTKETLTEYRNVLLVGDVIDQLRRLPDGIVQCVVTSPPYWGLRDYGTATWEGGDPQCDHKRDKWNGGKSIALESSTGHSKVEGGVGDAIYKKMCGKCGALRIDKQLGLEPTVQEYVEKMMLVFREVRRVLRDDGVLWLNLGDSYGGSGNGRNADGTHSAGEKQHSNKGSIEGNFYGHDFQSGLKPKDLVGVPWRVAFALQADGWWLRSECIWYKRNPMPESVTDRPTKAHEHIFLLTKSPRYFYDADAVRQPLSESFKKDSRWKTGSAPGNDKTGYKESGAQNPKQPHRMFDRDQSDIAGSNLRDVWDIPAAPYSGAHFATYPKELVERCIKAGSSAQGACGCCVSPMERVTKPTERYAAVLGESYHDHTADQEQGMKSVRGKNKQNKMRDAGISGREHETIGWQPTCECGSPLKRITEKYSHYEGGSAKAGRSHDEIRAMGKQSRSTDGGNIKSGPVPHVETVGWEKDCGHDLPETVPCIVLDPFAGSGTTLEVAHKLGRDYIGIELNPKYVEENIVPRMQQAEGIFGKLTIIQ